MYYLFTTKVSSYQKKTKEEIVPLLTGKDKDKDPLTFSIQDDDFPKFRVKKKNNKQTIEINPCALYCAITRE